MKNKLIFLVSIITSFFIGATATIVVYKVLPVNKEVIEKTIKEVNISETNSLSTSIEKIFDSVVYISSSKGREVGTGTGFVYKVDENYGYIITNNHVVENSVELNVTNSANATVLATIAGADAYSDLAVLKVDKSFVIKSAIFGDSTKVNVGDTIFTVGSPLGKEYINSVSKGIISGKNRTVSVTLSSGEFLMDVIQIDASINPGNSGGPLCNINGEVIGVNSMKLVDSSIEGMGFAIPIEIVKPTIEKLEQGKKVERPYVGVSMLNATDTWQLIRSGIYLDNNIEYGAVLVAISDDSPLVNAKLKVGDVITNIDGTKVETVAELRYLIYKHSIGDKIELTYIRNGKTSKTNIVLSKAMSN